jgi:hypothetical protein
MTGLRSSGERTGQSPRTITDLVSLKFLLTDRPCAPNRLRSAMKIAPVEVQAVLVLFSRADGSASLI